MKFTGNPEYRLLQVFLGRSGVKAQVFEVYVDLLNDDLCCTCPGWWLRHGCKHSDWVGEQIDLHGGYFTPIMRSDAEATPELAEDPVAFRRWLYTNGRVLMLE